tara:strand:+ start:291 stop:4112 length:3822 start_codon:yes stop_codon:yes gene_type:complete
MATTENLLNGTGSQTDFAFTFPYIKASDIKVSVGGVAKTVTTHYTLHNATTIRFTSGNLPPSGTGNVRIYRETDNESLQATFYPGSAIRAADLNDNSTQNLYVVQELDNKVDSAWKRGDDTVDSTETWHTSDDTKIGTTKAIENRINSQIDTALENDVLAGTDLAKTASGGQVTINHSVGGANTAINNSDGTVLQDITISAQGHVTAIGSKNLDDVYYTETELNAGQLDNRYFTETESDARFQPLDAELTELATMGSTTAAALADLTEAEVQILDGATVTTAELNILDGVTSTTAELNILDGVTTTTAELNILDGVTATTAELNKTDGLTASTAELNILDGVTATTAELNLLDGVTATTAELNKTDGLTSTPTELNILDGATANTSEINKLDGVTASTTELNIVAGKTFKTSSGTLTTTSDTEIPSSKVIAAHVASSITAVGGFKSIADEVSFPTTANFPATGVVVSINNAQGVVINGSGVSTTGRTTDGTPATVTINGFPSSLYNETLAAGVGLLVTATSTSNTYTYHKILVAETDVKQLSDDINDFNSRYRIASSAPGSNNDEGDLYFDTSSNKMKVYDGSAWEDVASVGSFYINTISSSSGTGGGSATFNGSAYRFTLSNPASGGAQQLIVSVNGVIQKPNTGTSQPSEGFAIDGNDIIFAAAPASGSDYFIVTQGSSVSIGTPSANSVNSSHIVDGSILNGDISSSADIAGTKIADDSIPEVKLDVHNGPSQGKFLGYTSNGLEWATPTDTNTVYTHPNHSGEVTSTADGAQVIADDVVDEANLKVSNSPTNGYFLSAQSGDTGGLTWAEVQSAPTVTAVASGALSTGAVVHLMSDGKVKVATETAASITSTTFEDNTYDAAACYDTANDKLVVIWSDGGNDSKGMGAVGTVDSNGDITFGTAVEFKGTETRKIDCCYEPGRGVVAIIYSNYDDNDKPAMILGKVSGTSISFHGNDNMNNEPSSSNAITAGPANKVLIQYRDGNYAHRLNVQTIDSDGEGFSNGTTRNIDGKSRYFAAAWSPTLERFCVTYADQADSNKLKAQLLSDDGTSQTGTNASAIEINSTSGQSTVGWDSVSEKFIVFAVGKAWVGTAGASTLSFGSSVDVDGGTSVSAINRCMHQNGTGKFRFFYVKSSSYKYVDGTVSGTSITFDTPVTMSTGAGDARTLVWNPDNSTYYYTLQNGGGDGKLGRFSPATTSVNDENYLGFSSANYSDGDTATINIVGNTITQSSLTPGQKYYVTNTGGISTSTGTANVAVGKALTSTNLLIL